MNAEAVPVERLDELFRLIDRLLGPEQADRHAATYTSAGMNEHSARAFALAGQAQRLRSLLAGLLSNRAGGVTPNAIDWAVGWLRAELDRGAEAGEQPGGGR